MDKIFSTISCFLLVGFFMTGGLSAQAEEIRLAIIVSEEDAHPIDLFIAQLELELSNFKGTSLLERSLIDKNLTEQILSETGFGDTAKEQSRVKWGELLPADILVIIEDIPKTIPGSYRLYMMESQTGIILNTIWLGSSPPMEDIPYIVKSIHEAMDKHKIPVDHRYFVGVLDVKSEEPGDLLDETAQMLRPYIEADIATDPQIVALDREQLQQLQFEKNLAGLQLKLKTSAILIDVGLRSSPKKKMLQVELSLKHLGNGKQEKFSMLVPKDDFLQMKIKIIGELQQRIKGKEMAETKVDREYEAKFFINRIPLLLSNGDYLEALRHAQTAYALKEDQPSRYWVARCWYHLAWDATKQFFLEGAKKNETRQNIIIDAMKSYINSLQMNYELTRHHINRFESGEEPHLKILDPYQSYREVPPNTGVNLKFTNYVQSEIFEGPLLFLVNKDDAKAKDLYDEIEKLEFEINTEQQEFYGRHYGETEETQKPYWDSWHNQQKVLIKYDPYDDEKYAKFLEKLVKAFQTHGQGDPSARLRGFWQIINRNGSGGRFISNKEKEFWQTFTDSEDITLVLLAKRILMNEDDLKLSKDFISMFRKVFFLNHSAWSIKDKAIWPEILRSPVNSLALHDRSGMLKEIWPFIDEILLKKDITHLLGWRHIFWVYVNALNLDGKKEEANGVVQRAIDVFDQKPIENYLTRDKRFRSELELFQVRAGFKKTLDPVWVPYFSYADETSFFGWHPDLQAPNLDQPILTGAEIEPKTPVQKVIVMVIRL